jgi:hypothetical protein
MQLGLEPDFVAVTDADLDNDTFESAFKTIRTK